jgi:hypothetical protein
MPVLIPIFKGEPLYNERVRLEGKDYIFRFDFNNREQRFYMNIKSEDGTPQLTGVKVVANWPLITRHRFNSALPPGELIAIDLETNGVPPVLADFGSRVKLYYYASDEDIAAIAAGDA